MSERLEILEFAISEEEKAAAFYRDLAQRVDRQWMKDVLLGFAEEEDGHKRKLQSIEKKGFSANVSTKVTDLKITDYLVDPKTEGELTYQDALILAAKKEKAAFKMYSDLAVLMDEPELKKLLEQLAHEEAKHKLRFELEYDEYVLKEN